MSAFGILNFILFTDDTNLFFSHNNDLSFTMNTIKKANKPSINIQKSSYMIFKTRQKRYIPEFSIEINNTKIKRVIEVVFLGVVLDLSWKPHISHISRKISKSIGIIYKSNFSLANSCLKCLYHLWDLYGFEKSVKS